MTHTLSNQLIDSSVPDACGGVPSVSVSGLGHASEVASGLKPAPRPAGSCLSVPETPANATFPSSGYPQGEKRNASRSNRSIKSAVRSLAWSQALAESSSYFANSPTPSRLLSRLNTSSICHRPRYRPNTDSARPARGFNEASTTTYSPNSSVWGCTLAPRSLRNTSLACWAAAVLLRAACSHTAQVRSWYSNFTFQVPGSCWCKLRSAPKRSKSLPWLSN